MWQLVSPRINHAPLIYHILPFGGRVTNRPLKGLIDGLMGFLSPGALLRESSPYLLLL